MKSRKAFTLIEIMIVVVIIGILAVALFPKLLGALGKTADEARKVELQNWTTILLQYKNDNFTYPASSGECINPDTGVGRILVEGKYVDGNKFPKDPNPKAKFQGCTQEGYFYYRSLEANGVTDNSFMAVAKMENNTKGNADTNALSAASKQAVSGLLKDKGDFYIVLGE